MDHDEYPTDEAIRDLRMIGNLMNKMGESLAKYELKHNLKYDSTVPSDIFNRMCLLVDYLDKKIGTKK